MIMDEVVMDEVSLAGQGTFGGSSPGQPNNNNRGIKRQAGDSALSNAPSNKRQRKGTFNIWFIDHSSNLFL